MFQFLKRALGLDDAQSKNLAKDSKNPVDRFVANGTEIAQSGLDHGVKPIDIVALAIMRSLTDRPPVSLELKSVNQGLRYQFASVFMATQGVLNCGSESKWKNAVDHTFDLMLEVEDKTHQGQFKRLIDTTFKAGYAAARRNDAEPGLSAEYYLAEWVLDDDGTPVNSVSAMMMSMLLTETRITMGAVARTALKSVS